MQARFRHLRSKSFQWYNECYKPLSFGPWNYSLKFQESIWDSNSHHGSSLGSVRVDSLTLFALPRACDMIPGSPIWLATLQPLVLVASPRLGLRQSESSFRSVGVHSHTFLHSQEHEMRLPGSLLARTFASPCLGCSTTQIDSMKHCNTKIIAIKTICGIPSLYYDGLWSNLKRFAPIHHKFWFYVNDLICCVWRTERKYCVNRPLVPSRQLVQVGTDWTQFEVIALEEA
jgi:hypothetical protein